jgi:imidazolonepropionase-like amidohydrolase
LRPGTGLRVAAGMLLAAWVPPPPAMAAQSTSGVAFVNATVVDVERGVLIPRQTVITSGATIESVGPSTTRIPPGRTRVDLRGAYVIPGLWDMHVHLAVQGAQVADLVGYHGSLLLAHGVTGVRDAGGDATVLAAMDSLGRASPGSMPRVIYPGDKILTDASDRIASFERELQSRIASGATFAKLHADFPVEHVREAAAACARRQLRCVAHVPAADTSLWLNVPGRGSYEHLFNLAEQVSSEPAVGLFAEAREYELPTIRQRILYKLRLRKRPAEPRLRRFAVRDTTRDREFFTRVAQSGTWITPTLVLHQFMTGVVPLPPSASDTSLSLAKPSSAPRAAAALEVAGRDWQLWTRLTRALSSGGVNLLAGTDFGSTHVPGSILHAELLLLQQAGVPAPDVLRMATSNPARYLSATDSLGTVNPGRVADLVILRRNPLEDIRNVSEVEMVMTRGTLLRRAALDSLVANARRARVPVSRAMESRNAVR